MIYEGSRQKSSRTSALLYLKADTLHHHWTSYKPRAMRNFDEQNVNRNLPTNVALKVYNVIKSNDQAEQRAIPDKLTYNE